MDKLLDKILSPHSHWTDRFVPNYNELKELVHECRKRGKKVVLTQGVYDLIHEGHALYLEKARERGDLLLVAVDSDDLTRKRKGPDRPVVPQEERLKMLAHLRHVDLLTLKDADQGLGDIIFAVKPDVFVVSESTKDFTDEMVREYKDVCGEIVVLPPQATTSTTARIRALTIEGAHKLSREIQKLTEDFVKKIRG